MQNTPNFSSSENYRYPCITDITTGSVLHTLQQCWLDENNQK